MAFKAGVAALISVASAFELPNLADLGMAAVLEFADEPIQSTRSMQEGLPVVKSSYMVATQSLYIDNVAAKHISNMMDLKPEAEVMMHGMGDFGNNPMGMVPLRKLIAQTANAYVHSVELCSDPTKLADCDTQDQSNGFFMTMDAQVDQFARVVRADEKLSGGFNAVGFSQGNTVIRGYIHKYNNPPVKTFLSMHGVLMGVNGLPQCPMSVPGVGVLCRAVDAIVSHAGVYSSFVQNRLAQANYYRDAENLGQYRTHGHFLPYINNEIQGHQNATYKKNFQSLDKLVLVMAEDDTMVHPKESEHFGYFKDGSRTQLVAMRDAPWYTEDWFGLKSLDQAKKIEFHSTPGNHLRFKKEFLVEMVQRYFVTESSVVV